VAIKNGQSIETDNCKPPLQLNAPRRWLYRGTLSCAMCFLIALMLYNRKYHVKPHKFPSFVCIAFVLLVDPTLICLDISIFFYLKQHFVVYETKNTTQCALDTTIRKQPQITLIRHERSYKQPEVKTNQPSFVCGNHHTEPKTSRHIIGEHKALQRWATRILMTNYSSININV
jgi:hypothetical protein